MASTCRGQGFCSPSCDGPGRHPHARKSHQPEMLVLLALRELGDMVASRLVDNSKSTLSLQEAWNLHHFYFEYLLDSLHFT